MKLLSSLLLLFLGVHVAGCSKAVEENNVGTSGLKAADNVLVNSKVNPQDTPSQSVESSSPNPQDVVLFDGKNYIKKSGWKTPSKKNAYIDEKYDQGNTERVTKSGKRVRTKASSYFIGPPWQYSQDFSYKGGELDYLKGKLTSNNFLEMSVNGKVFLYSISAEKVVSPAPSNNDPHEDPFVYEIMDSDGDGIFETLLGDYDEIIVPNWVLK